ncbi:MAG: AsmA family protein [Pseudomonadota bacterium]|nr:AsmA family protein [Pseudomonadota bacterium]
MVLTRSNPWLRRTLFAVGGLFLLLVIAAGVLIATFDANRYKVLAVDWMRDTHQRTLVIAGPVELKVFPRLAVKVSKVSLSEVNSADRFLSVDQAELSVSMLPLLRKQLVIDQVSASGVEAAYLRDAKGVRNIDDLVATEDVPPSAESSASSATGSALAFDVSAVQLDNVRVRVRDEMAPLQGQLELQSFTSGRLAPGRVTPITVKASLQLSRPQVAALKIDGSGQLSVDLRKNGVSMSGLALAINGDAGAVKGLAMTLAGDLAWDGRALQAGPLKLALQAATLGDTHLAASTIDLEQVLLSPAAQRVELQNLKAALAGQQGASPFTLALAWSKLMVDGQQIAGGALSGSFELSGLNTVKASFQSAAPSGQFDAIKLPGVKLDIDATQGLRKLVGRLSGDLQVSTGSKAPAGAVFDNLMLAATLNDPGLAPLKVALKGRLHIDTGPAEKPAASAGWDLQGTLNANRFESNGSAVLSGTVPRIAATGRFDSLDLNSLMGPEKPATTTAAAPAETPVDLSGLKSVDGQFMFSAGVLKFRQYRVDDARVEAALDNGKLTVPSLTGRAWGGSLSASGKAEAGSNRIAVDLKADGVDVAALLKNVADKDLLSGTGQVTADLRTGGSTLGALRSALSGTARLNVRDGAVKGFNLAQALRNAKAIFGGKPDAEARANASEKTDFSALNVSATIDRGVARSDDLELKSPFLRIGGDGLFDIGKSRIDYTARATVIGSAKGQGGADLDMLKGVTVPVRLTGPFDAIEWKILWSQVAAKAVENQLKEKLNDKLGELLGGGRGESSDAAASSPQSPKRQLEDQLRDQLKGGLKGLFK